MDGDQTIGRLNYASAIISFSSDAAAGDEYAAIAGRSQDPLRTVAQRGHAFARDLSDAITAIGVNSARMIAGRGHVSCVDAYPGFFDTGSDALPAAQDVTHGHFYVHMTKGLNAEGAGAGGADVAAIDNRAAPEAGRNRPNTVRVGAGRTNVAAREVDVAVGLIDVRSGA